MAAYIDEGNGDQPVELGPTYAELRAVADAADAYVPRVESGERFAALVNALIAAGYPHSPVNDAPAAVERDARLAEIQRRHPGVGRPG